MAKIPEAGAAKPDGREGKEEGMSLSRILFSFEGRITRSTFWYYLAGLVLAGIVARLLDGGIAARAAGNSGSGFGCFTVFYVLLGGVSLLAVGVKRFHDRDLPGSRMWFGLIPIAGQLWLLYELGFKEGKPGWNMYGEDPRGKKQASS
jgi:uncharacterized membrane protein YhaH (DUF805 family)